MFSGIIPKVITKDMYEDSLKITKRIEETITLATNDCCKINETTTVNNGIREYNSYSECSLIVSKITLAIMIKLVPPKETLAPNTPLNTKVIHLRL